MAGTPEGRPYSPRLSQQFDLRRSFVCQKESPITLHSPRLLSSTPDSAISWYQETFRDSLAAVETIIYDDDAIVVSHSVNRKTSKAAQTDTYSAFDSQTGLLNYVATYKQISPHKAALLQISVLTYNKVVDVDFMPGVQDDGIVDVVKNTIYRDDLRSRWKQTRSVGEIPLSAFAESEESTRRLLYGDFNIPEEDPTSLDDTGKALLAFVNEQCARTPGNKNLRLIKMPR